MEIGALYDVDQLRELGGVVDYVVGTPLTEGLLPRRARPIRSSSHYLELYKMGKGPLYSFFIPYHLVHFEVPFAIARAVLFRDSRREAVGGACVEVCAVAKRDLEAGETLDNVRHVHDLRRGRTRRHEMSERRYLPEGLAVGCTLRRDIAKDEVLAYDDVDVPAGRSATACAPSSWSGSRASRGSPTCSAPTHSVGQHLRPRAWV